MLEACESLRWCAKRCRKEVGDDEGLQCDLCKGCLHASCGSMTKGLKKELLKAGREKKGVHWFCMDCSQDVKGIFRSMQDLKARMVALEEEVSRFTRTEGSSEEAKKDEGRAAEGQNEKIEAGGQEEADFAGSQDEEMVAGGLNRLRGEQGKSKERSDDGQNQVGHDQGIKEQKADEPLPNGFVVQKRRQSYSFLAAKSKVGEAKPDGVETRNRFGVLTEEGQADIETINSQTVLIGSSMAGSVGRALHWQLRGAFVWMKYSGAKIEGIAERLQEIELEEKVKNLVLIVGTNNLKNDGTEDIMEKYEELIWTAKEKGDRKIVVVGIISRSDLGDYYESKGLGINIRLKRKCDAMGVKYVEMGGQFKERDSVLWDDGLHLNDAGAYKMGKAIFDRIFPRFLPQRRPGDRGN